MNGGKLGSRSAAVQNPSQKLIPQPVGRISESVIRHSSATKRWITPSANPPLADDYNNVVRRFIIRAQSIPYYVNFCSLTGEYCVNQVEENCG